MIVVLDTNVLISSTIQSQGFSAHIRRLWETKYIQVATSEAILQEYRRVLSYPHIVKRHHLSPEALDRFVARVREKAIVVSGAIDVGQVSVDPDDDKFLACAVEAGADLIVSGDPHLLDIQEFRDTPIVTPRTCVEFILSKQAA